MLKILYLLLEFGSSQCEIIGDFHLPNASLFWPKITLKEQRRAGSCASEPVQKMTGRKELRKKEMVSVINRMCILLSPIQQPALSVH
jgi:hypothetical protein